MKKFALSLLVAACALGLIVAPASAAKKPKMSLEELAKQMVTNYKAAKGLVTPSTKVKIKRLRDAYKLQQVFVNQLKASHGKAVGYKAGITSQASRKRFKVRSAVTGVLLEKMFYAPGAVIDRKAYTRLFIEVEIGFILAKPITKPIRKLKDLRAYVAAVVPAIELPDINIADLKTMTGRDIIAINVGARGYIIGAKQKVGALKLDDIPITLAYNGKVVQKGLGKNTQRGQWDALRWAINNVLKYGGQLKAGDVIITGTLSGMFPGKPGKYLATYGPLGKLEFSIK